MNKLFYSILFAFCLGYITSSLNSDLKLFSIEPVYADATNISDDDEEIDLAAVLEDLEFRQAVKEIVEDCTVEDSKIHC